MRRRGETRGTAHGRVGPDAEEQEELAREAGGSGHIRSSIGDLLVSRICPAKSPAIVCDAVFGTYLRRELVNRRRQTLIVAIGMALAIALVLVVNAVAGGVKTAQAVALQSVYGVGTDITVTKAATTATAVRSASVSDPDRARRAAAPAPSTGTASRSSAG